MACRNKAIACSMLSSGEPTERTIYAVDRCNYGVFGPIPTITATTTTITESNMNARTVCKHPCQHRVWEEGRRGKGEGGKMKRGRRLQWRDGVVPKTQ